MSPDLVLENSESYISLCLQTRTISSTERSQLALFAPPLSLPNEGSFDKRSRVVLDHQASACCSKEGALRETSLNGLARFEIFPPIPVHFCTHSDSASSQLI